MNKHSSQTYSGTAKFLHWVIGVTIITLICVGIYMANIDFDGDGGVRSQLYGLHKSTGIVVLGLMVCRVLWRTFTTYPASNTVHKKWEIILSKLVHGVLYIMAFSMPLSGWAMSSSYGSTVSVYGLFKLPPLVKENPPMGETWAVIHEFGGYALIAVIVIHAAGALKHHIIDRDDTLRRMLPFSK